MPQGTLSPQASTGTLLLGLCGVTVPGLYFIPAHLPRVYPNLSSADFAEASFPIYVPLFPKVLAGIAGSTPALHPVVPGAYDGAAVGGVGAGVFVGAGVGR